MRKLLIPLFLVLLLVAACRRERETATPTAEATRPPTATSTVPAATRPPATVTPTPAVTASPDFGRIDPDLIDWAPQVIYASPLPGEEALLDGAITIRFDQPMNQPSVEQAFQIQASAADDAVAGELSWPEPDTLVFTPEGRLARNENYRILIGTRATGRNGQRLQDPVELMFQTTGFLEVAQIIPRDGSDSIDTDASITVLFNRPVVPLVSTGEQQNLPQPITIEPAVSGQGEWISTSIFRFTPDDALEGATTYEVTIAAGLEDVTGGVLAEDATSSFTTLQPSVTAIVPGAGETEVAPTTTITVTFNMPMEREPTESAITLGPDTRLGFSWVDDRTVVITPQQMLDLETRYSLTVGEEARATGGGATLDRLTTSAFTTVPFPRVARTSPRGGEEAPSYQYGINIEFTAPIDPDTIEGRLQISPEPADTNYYINGKWVSVDFPMERKTSYRVTVPADVADPYGNTLGEIYTWQFTTPPLASLVSLNLPWNISQLTSEAPTTVDIIYRNVSRVEAALYDLGLPITTLLEPYRANEMGVPGPAVRTWNVSVEAPEDIARYTTVDLGDIPTGIYLLTATGPEVNSESRYWQNQRNLLIIGDTNIVVKEMFGAVHVWVTELSSGEPAAGRELALYNLNGVEIGTATSDANGFASFGYEPPRDYLPGVVVVTGQPGAANFGVGSSNWNQGASPWEFNISATSSDEAALFAYIYTDRPIYRPGDTVHYRGIVRDPDYGRYTLPERELVDVRIQTFSWYEPAQQVEEVRLELDRYGAFSGDFVIPEDATLGQYEISLVMDGPTMARTFTVAEYRRPEFLVTVTPEITETVRGETVDVVVEARYFFGAPASDLELEWVVREHSYHLPWSGPPYYSFTDEDVFYYFDSWDSDFYGNYVRGGNGRTDTDGRFVLTLPAGLLDDIEDGSRVVTVEATVRDLSDFPVSANGQLIFHAAVRYVGITPANYLSEAGEEVAVQLITVDWEREPLAGQEVEVVFYERDYERVRETRPGYWPGDRWVSVDTEVARTTVTSNAGGEAGATFVPTIGGTYRAVATVRDSAGRSHRSSTLFWVTSGEFILWHSNQEMKRMDLTADQPSYEVGDTARILVQSPFAGPVRAWLTIERGALIEQQLVTLASSSEIIEIPIRDAFAPNAFVTVVAIQGARGDEQFADIRLGIAELIIPPDQFALDVSLTPQSELLGPGDTVSYEIRVTGAAGSPVQASVSLALVDLAVLTLQPDNAPPILEAFYERQPYRSQNGSGLFVSGEGLDIDVPVEMFGGGGGGGGPDMAQSLSLLLDEEEEPGVRQDFPDTAYWRASITTDSNGSATVDIPLPDTLTTWRLHAKAVTTETQVGQASVDIVTSLPLLLRPVTPRFFTVNDRVLIGAIVNNNTQQGLDVTVTLEADGLVIDGDSSRQVSVRAGGQQIVRWPVTVLDVIAADLTFRAEGGDYRDATKPSFGQGPDQLIPVYRYDAEDLVGTSGVLVEAGQRVEAFLVPPQVNTRQGSVDVQVTASLAGALLQGLEYINDPQVLDLSCAHGVVNQFLPNLAIVRAFRDLGLEPPELDVNADDLIERSIRRLAQLQMSGGGWGWCYSQQVDSYLTAYVLYGLYHAGAEGYDLAGIDVQSALRRLTIRDADSVATTWDANRQAWFLYVRALWDAAEVEDLDALVEVQRELLDPYARAYLVMAYNRIDRNNPHQQALLSDLANEAVISATGAHWENSDEDWRNLSTDIRGTAVVIAALAELDPNHAMATQAVRWLMAARQAGHWSTPFETTWSLVALTDWMMATGELDAAFSYELRANRAELGQGTFDRDNATSVDSYSVPLAAVPEDGPNFLIFERSEGPGRLYYTAHMDAFINAESVAAVNRGFTVERAYYDAGCDPEEQTCAPLTSIAAGQRVRVELTIITPHDRTFVRVEDPLPAGAYAIDPALETSVVGLGGTVMRTDRTNYYYGYWGWWYFNRIEYRDDRVVFFSNFLPAGTYQYSYTLETPIPGEYQVRPAVAYEEFFPEVFGRSAGMAFDIEE
jgi:alpha-2-macroglobulin